MRGANRVHSFSKREQFRLFRVQSWPKIREALLQFTLKTNRVGIVLELQRDIIRVSRDDHITRRRSLPPLTVPKVYSTSRASRGH